jgi:hypothetical protein
MSRQEHAGLLDHRKIAESYKCQVTGVLSKYFFSGFERMPEMKKLISLVSLLTLLLSACASQAQTAAAGHYAGQVEGSNAFIGLVTNGKQLGAFFCDGTEGAAPVVWGWFQGDLNGSAFDLTNEKGDRLAGNFEANGASGTITLADTNALSFQAQPVDQPAGLYRFEETIDGVETLTGWIVLANGHWRGGRKIGTQLTAASGKPVSWVEPDPQPWVEPDTQP